MRIKGMPVAAAAGLVVLLLAGCSDQLGDRGGHEGAAPDKIGDVDRVEVFRNIDNFPNIARICVEGLAFAATSSSDGETDPSLLRVPEWDARCPGGTAAASSPPASAPATSSSG